MPFVTSPDFQLKFPSARGTRTRRRCGRFCRSGGAVPMMRFLLPPTTVSSVLPLLLVTTSVLARTALPPPARPAGHGNSPMRRLSLVPPPSYRSSSSNSNNTVPLPLTPPITPPLISHIFRVPPAATSSSWTATQDTHLLEPKTP